MKHFFVVGEVASGTEHYHCSRKSRQKYGHKRFMCNGGETTTQRSLSTTGEKVCIMLTSEKKILLECCKRLLAESSCSTLP